MKKTLLFISLLLCFGIANSQTALPTSRDNTPVQGQKQVVNPDHVPTVFKPVSNPKNDPIDPGNVRITLTAGDVWGDGSGYQLLLDADATAYGTAIPEQGPITDAGDAPSDFYEFFDYAIPTNADGSLTTTNIVMNASISIDIPAGTYDWVVTNPTPGDRMWVAGNGRADDYVFVDGNHYTFTVALSGGGDNVTITVYDPNLPQPSIVWDFQDGIMPDVFTLYDDGHRLNENISMMFESVWDVITYDQAEYFAASSSWFMNPAPANKWMVTPLMNLSDGNMLQFDIKSQDPDYPEAMSVKLSNTTIDQSAFTHVLWSDNEVSPSFTTHTIDLSDFDGQNIYVAFILESYDAFIGCVDNIKFLGSTSSLDKVENTDFFIYPNPANDVVTISGASGSQVYIYDLMGRVVLKDEATRDNHSISIANLETGIYTVRIINNGVASTSKLIKN